jgi:5'-phosphate synthase pdxT subunit
MDAPLIGILALQGCVQPHRRHFEAAGARVREIRAAADFEGVDALVVPGGESTTMLKLLRNFGLEESFLSVACTRPYWGVCAGSILAAREVSNPAQKSFGIVDAKIARNGYGRQKDSFETDLLGSEVSFIRAPIIESVGPGVEVLAVRDGHPVWVRERLAWLTTFHPELASHAPSPFHERFLELVEAHRVNRAPASATLPLHAEAP